MKSFIIAVLLLGLSLTAQAGETPTPSTAAPAIYIAPLTAEDGQVPNWAPYIGKGIAKMIITSLSGSGRFKVIDTTLTDDLAQDLKSIVPSRQKNGSAARPAVDLIFHGKVSQFGSKSSGFNVKEIFNLSSLPGGGPKAVNAAIRIDWALVDANTQTVVTNGSTQFSERGFGFDLASAGGTPGKAMTSPWARLGMAVATNVADQTTGVVGVVHDSSNVDYGNALFMKSALGLATCKAVTNVIEALNAANLPEMDPSRARVQIETKEAPIQTAASAVAATPSLGRASPAHAATPATSQSETPAPPITGKVVAVVNKGTIIVSIGSKNGLKNGDKVDLFQTIDLKDDKGVVVFSEEKQAGEITLESVQEEKSKGNYAGDLAIKSGWIVKIKPAGEPGTKVPSASTAIVAQATSSRDAANSAKSSAKDKPVLH